MSVALAQDSEGAQSLHGWKRSRQIHRRKNSLQSVRHKDAISGSGNLGACRVLETWGAKLHLTLCASWASVGSFSILLKEGYWNKRFSDLTLSSLYHYAYFPSAAAWKFMFTSVDVCGAVVSAGEREEMSIPCSSLSCFPTLPAGTKADFSSGHP